MGLYNMGPPEDLVLALQKQLGLADFVETGTFRGGTSSWAAGHFARVTTVELSPVFHAAAVARFQDQSGIQPLCGASPAVLRAVVPALTGPALFWLDAHWSGADTAGKEAECPVLEEIEIINQSPLGHVILVDDARLFCAPPPHPHRADHWPDLATVTTILGGHGRRHVALTEDVFVAVPAAAKDFLTGWFQDAAARPAREHGLRRWWRKFRP